MTPRSAHVRYYCRRFRNLTTVLDESDSRIKQAGLGSLPSHQREAIVEVE